MAQPLSPKDVQDIALLARLELSPDEVESLRTELTDILQHMDALAGLDTGDVEPMTHAVPMPQRLRADEPAASLPVDVALGSAPDRADDHFQVPNIIKKQGKKQGQQGQGG